MKHRSTRRAPAAWQLLSGDSIVALRELESSSVDAVITDPPYSSGGQFRGDRVKADTNRKYQGTDVKRSYPQLSGDHRDSRGYLAWCTLWLAECWRIAREGAVLAVFSDWRQLPTTTDAIQAGGWVWRGIMVWDKVTCRPQLGRPRHQAEFVAWGSKGGMPTDRNAPVLAGVHRIPISPVAKHHVTGKPVPLMRELAKLAEPGSLILDPFAGSGSTGVGALLEGRRFVGIELNDAYVDIARERLAAAELDDADTSRARAA